MESHAFRTTDGRGVPAVTAAEMRAVDRIAVEEVGLSLLMMMEHAGRGLADAIHAHVPEGSITVLAGGGGNGGGGLCAARHLANHGRDVAIVLDRPPAELAEAPARQYRVLGQAVTDLTGSAQPAIADAGVVVDALVGYSLRGSPRGRLAELIGLVDAEAARTVSLDVPSGVDATTGDRPGVAIEPALTVTLALPKTGLSAVRGEIELVDLGIPARVFEEAEIPYESPFAEQTYRISLEKASD